MISKLLIRFFKMFIKLLRILNYKRIVYKKVHGVKYELDLSENIDWSLYFFGYYERRTSKAISSFIKPDMVVVEIGANIGAHTFEIAKILARGKGTIYSFEPVSYVFKKLDKNYHLNTFTNIILKQCALSDKNGDFDISRDSTPETMPFKANWDLKGKLKGPKEDRIHFEKMDDWVAENKIVRIDFIKMDVDGNEFRVIKGGMNVLRTMKPILMIELGITLERMGDSLTDMINMLFGLGYSIHSLDSSHKKYTREELLVTINNARTIDCLCLPDNYYQ